MKALTRRARCVWDKARTLLSLPVAYLPMPKCWAFGKPCLLSVVMAQPRPRHFACREWCVLPGFPWMFSGNQEIVRTVIQFGGAPENPLQRSVLPTLILVPRGSTGLGVAIPQWKPRPGASSALAIGEPIMTASAPQAMHLQISPPVTMPPSAMMGT